MRKSIQKRLAIHFLVLAVAPLFIIGSIITYETYAIEKKGAIILQREIADHLSARVYSFIQNLESLIRITLQAQNFLKLSQTQQKSVMSLLISRQPAIDELVLLDANGQEAIFISRLGLYDESVVKRQTDSNIFQIPISKGVTYYSMVRFRETTGEPFIVVAIPITKLKTGRSQGVLVADIRLTKIWNLVASINPGPKGDSYIVDSKNRVVAHRNPSVVLKGTRFTPPGPDGIYIGLNGKTSVIVQKIIRFGDKKFYTIVESPVSEALALAINTVYIITVVIFAAAIVAGFFGVLAVRQIIRPIQRIAATAKAISSGDLSSTVEINSQDELGVLADAFNSMTIQLRTLINSLEQRVSQRTAALEAANKELEAFSYSVSHDLRSPLRHIVGFISLLRKQSESRLDQKGQRYLEIISNAAQRLGLLIDHLLEFSRTGRQEIEKSPVDLHALVTEVIQEEREGTNGRDIVWTIESLPEVHADRSMLRLVIANLITNALKFTRTKKTAEISIGTDLENEHEITFFIKDNGVGFDMRYKDKLFGVFQRLHSSDDFEGTGIGLANVRRIIQRHGGKTWAESALGKGAAFYFSIPRT